MTVRFSGARAAPKAISNVVPPGHAHKAGLFCARLSPQIASAVDFAEHRLDNWVMSIDVSSAVDPIELADSQAVIEHLMHGTQLDPEVDRRVHQRAAKITDALRRKYAPSTSPSTSFGKSARNEARSRLERRTQDRVARGRFGAR